MSGDIMGPAIMLMVAGAPYYDLAIEREGAPLYFPRRSGPFYIIFPPFSLPVIIGHHEILLVK